MFQRLAARALCRELTGKGSHEPLALRDERLALKDLSLARKNLGLARETLLFEGETRQG